MSSSTHEARTVQERLRAALREPLLHFVLLGGLLFSLHRAWSTGDLPQERVTVDAQRRRELTALFEQRMQRKPSAEELAASEQRWIEEEVLFREGVRLDLVRSDPELRDQLIARMRAMLQGSLSGTTPSDAELEAFHATQRDRYRVPAVLTFIEYLVPTGSRADDGARELLRRLRAGEPTGLIPVTSSRRSRAELVALYGEELTDKIDALPLESWQIIRSLRGLHVVRVTERREAQDPSWREVRARVASDLLAERMRTGFQAQLAELTRRWQGEP